MRDSRGAQHETWFWWFQASWVSPGWGPHDRGETLYVGSEYATGVAEWLGAGVLRRSSRRAS